MSLRRTGIQRKTDLRRAGELARTPLARGKGLRTRKAAAAKRPKDTGPSPAQRTQVMLRAGWCCERCGLGIHAGVEFSVHHRLPRGRGGRNVLSNLVLLCGSGVTGCHGQVESQRTAAYDTGWLVETGISPAAKPALVINRGYVFLTDDGTYLEAA